METSNPAVGISNTAFREAHKESDVDAEPSAQHHTLGRGPNQAAFGNHGHETPSPSTDPPDRPAIGDVWVVTDMDNLRRRWDGVTWNDEKLGSLALDEITANTFKTADSGQRVEIMGYGSYSTNEISFYSGNFYETYPGAVYSDDAAYGSEYYGWVGIYAPTMGGQSPGFLQVRSKTPSGVVPNYALYSGNGLFYHNGAFTANGNITAYGSMTVNSNLNVSGSISGSSVSATNVFFATGYIYGLVCGDNNVSTDGSGIGYFYHGLGTTPRVASFTSRIVNRNITVADKNSSYIQLYVRQADTNTPAAGVTQSFEYLLIA